MVNCKPDTFVKLSRYTGTKNVSVEMQGTSIVSALRMTACAEVLLEKTPAVSRNRINKIFFMVFNVKLLKIEGNALTNFKN